MSEREFWRTPEYEAAAARQRYAHTKLLAVAVEWHDGGETPKLTRKLSEAVAGYLVACKQTANAMDAARAEVAR